jgi:hypothetical protein
LACRFIEQQQQRMAAVAAGLDALKQHQTELHMSAAELGAAARLEAAEQQLTDLQQVLQQADAAHAAKVEQILHQLTKVRCQQLECMIVYVGYSDACCLAPSAYLQTSADWFVY